LIGLYQKVVPFLQNHCLESNRNQYVSKENTENSLEPINNEIERKIESWKLFLRDWNYSSSYNHY
jgi:hypothetical protein